MAFTQTPTMDTYSSQKVSLFREINLRDGGASGKDEDYLNVFMEPVKQSKAEDKRNFIFKRAGTTQVVASVSANTIRGWHFWADQQKLYYCVEKNIYVYSVNTGSSATLSNVFSTTSGSVGFCEFLYDNGTVKIIATDGTAISGLVTIDSSNTVVTNTDADLPTHLPSPIFLDGYLFVVKSNTAEIYNSSNNDPLSWDSTTYIQAEMEADLIVKITKLNNYLVVFGKESVEYYWDAGNPAPDSPLQRNDTPIKFNTYIAGLSVYGNSIYYIGADSSGQPDVFVLKDFKIESIGSNSISRYLNTAGDTLAEWNGVIVSLQGHTFYIVNAGTNKTWALDVDTGLTTRFAYQAETIFDIVLSLVISSSSSVSTYFVLNNNTSAIYKFDESLYQDNGVNFTCIITTEGNAFGTMNRKTMHRLSIIGDRPSANSNILLTWSDDDQKTYSAGTYINLNQDLPCARQLGSFRQRVFKFLFTDNYPLRIQDVEVDINKGNS